MQQGRDPPTPAKAGLQGLHRQDPGRLQGRHASLHRDSQDRPRLTRRPDRPLCYISTVIWLLPSTGSSSDDLSVEQLRVTADPVGHRERTDRRSIRPHPTERHGQSAAVRVERLLRRWPSTKPAARPRPSAMRTRQRAGHCAP